MVVAVVTAGFLYHATVHYPCWRDFAVYIRELSLFSVAGEIRKPTS